MIKSAMGYAVLAGMTSVLFVLALLDSVNVHGAHILSALSIGVLLILLLEEGREFAPGVLGSGEDSRWERRDAYDFLFLVAAAAATFFLSVNMAWGAVVASSAVGILVALIKPAYAVPAYCGSFVGMACGATFGYPYLLLAALPAGLIYVSSKSVFDGYGGKLGTIAFSGCVGAMLLTDMSFTVAAPPTEIWLGIVLVAVAAGVMTYILSVRLAFNVVFSSAIVGLVAGLLLPIIEPEHGFTLALMAFCASFAGMSSRKRVPSESYMAAGTLLCALVFIYAVPHFGATGGKLGTIAFGSVIAVFGMYKAVGFVSKKVLPEDLLLRPTISQDTCTLCEQCVENCPVGVLVKHGSRILVGNVLDCTRCMECASACEQNAIKLQRGRNIGF